jgi:hypothetical protein
MLARFLLTNDRTAREHGEHSKMDDHVGELTRDCLDQSSHEHRGRDDLQGHWVDAKDTRASHNQYVGDC